MYLALAVNMLFDNMLFHSNGNGKRWVSLGAHLPKRSSIFFVNKLYLYGDPKKADKPFQIWLELTAGFKWPCEPHWQNTASSTHSYDSRPESDLHFDDTTQTDNLHDQCENNCQFTQKLVLRPRDLKTVESGEFNEGPFLKMLLKLLSSMPSQPYQLNLHLTSIISKLAMLPHPNLHEYLLNPLLSTAQKTRTLFKTLKEVAFRLTAEIPRLKNYRQVIENTRLQLMSEDPAYDERLVIFFLMFW